MTKPKPEKRVSPMTGVYWHQRGQKWVAMYRRRHLGNFDNMADAIEQRKLAEYLDPSPRPAKRKSCRVVPDYDDNTDPEALGGYVTDKGISHHYPANKWRVSITVKGKTHYLGNYRSLNAAREARRFGLRKYRGD